MNPRVILPFLVLALIATAQPAEARTGQDENSAADPTEPLQQLAQGLKQRKTHDDDLRHEADGKVVDALDQLLLDFPGYGEKQQKKVAVEIGKIFRLRTKEGEDRIYVAAAACLSEMGPRGEKSLLSAMKVKHLAKRPDVQVTLIEALGKHRDPKNIGLFVDLMKKADTKIVVAAVRALAEYRNGAAKLRKKIAEELVKQYANANSLDLKERHKNPVFRERLLAVEVPMNEALGALTLQNFQSAPQWQKWFNDNRGKRW